MASNLKRKRKPDYTREETEELIKLFVENNDYLSAKFSPSVTHQGKVELITMIQMRVNAVGQNQRTVESIKEKWQNMKAKIKTKAT